jgi:tetratricopeptide (TPR) repeat protein
MSVLKLKLTTMSKDIVHKINLKIDARQFEEALTLIYPLFRQEFDFGDQQNTLLGCTLACSLIDIGGENLEEKPIQEGVRFFEEHHQSLSAFISKSSIEYYIGNGKGNLFKVANKGVRNFHFSPENIDLLCQAKDHYWRAYKLSRPHETGLQVQVLVNLANTLNTSGRVAEAMQYFDLALQKHPGFPQALASRAEALLWLVRLSRSHTIHLLWQITNGYKIAASKLDLPSWRVEEIKLSTEPLRKELEKHDFSEEDIIQDFQETIKEATSHSDYQLFCIFENLILSEHALYCPCIASSKDNLVVSSVSIGGDFVPRMEHILNRLKSEYSLARTLYYQSATGKGAGLEIFDIATFTELYEDESIGIRTEMLRSSFRLCFGILDKIAFAICELFDLADPKEVIYFESFWRPRGRLSDKQKQRWKKINSINNPSLLALYSQATDLNSKSGEWGIFKSWRNSLEHRIMTLTLDEGSFSDIYGVLNKDADTLNVKYADFKEKTLHLLQLTRSAIFNFVFCVRQEGAKYTNESAGSNLTISLSDKLTHH